MYYVRIINITTIFRGITRLHAAVVALERDGRGAEHPPDNGKVARELFGGGCSAPNAFQFPCPAQPTLLYRGKSPTKCGAAALSIILYYTHESTRVLSSSSCPLSVYNIKLPLSPRYGSHLLTVLESFSYTPWI